MLYLDSNIFIYPAIYSSSSEPKVEKAKEILSNIEFGKIEAYTSTLTWDEVVWVVSKVMGRTEGVNLGKKLLGFPNLKFIPTDSSIVSRAQKLMEKYKINPRDAIHIASALDKKIIEVVSDDSELEIIKETKRVPL